MEKLSDYDYILPKESIALYPKERGHSRLLAILNNQTIDHENFGSIINYINSGDILVVNNTKVMKARINLYKKSGGKVELLLVRPLENSCWQVLMNGNGPFLAEQELYSDKIGQERAIKIINKSTEEAGLYNIESFIDLYKLAKEEGFMPLPAYLGRQAEKSDEENYQAIFAKEHNWGAVAAPTASLHFSREIIEKLKAKGVKIVELTLHVGPGTFLPVRTENIAEHRMHKEYFSLSQEAAEAINLAKASNKKIIAVGTTALRTLEHAAFLAEQNQTKLEACFGSTEIFIRPGFKFRSANALITNFHVPKSTLLMLVAAICGKDRIIKIYEEAIKLGYKFFSYGDATYIEIGKFNDQI